jgi:hypothetical protein
MLITITLILLVNTSKDLKLIMKSVNLERKRESAKKKQIKN